MGDRLLPRLLIPDNTPLSLLSLLGSTALDWLFIPGAEVWITDMVRDEALWEPDPGNDQRAGQRAVLAAWFGANAHRIRIRATPVGQDYERQMRNWIGSGRVPGDRPVRDNLGERTIAGLLSVVGQIIADGEAVVLLVDDRAARALLIQAARTEGLDADIMATETFLRLLEEDFGVVDARLAWMAISVAAGDRQPASPARDPIHVRR